MAQIQHKSETYEEFVDKFKPKKTTDDCYTPPEIYEVILGWAASRYGFDPSCVVRPFRLMWSTVSAVTRMTMCFASARAEFSATSRMWSEISGRGETWNKCSYLFYV